MFYGISPSNPFVPIYQVTTILYKNIKWNAGGYPYRGLSLVNVYNLKMKREKSWDKNKIKYNKK